jgi:hypothetical protein
MAGLGLETSQREKEERICEVQSWHADIILIAKPTLPARRWASAIARNALKIVRRAPTLALTVRSGHSA